ncbi:MAG: hypothetical protein A2X05_05190 [Bacteroidetes bacterium GWE2_41_25]|nr:MAG: hypothetical protein A2X03_01605 [Bacteroidetes bacterium GWA2_40_15]OFX92292.1 MAG: hypothetical protein A2X05_05190 [Bacteroidetes bacterium GWE2_41_25]OFY57052.1 MAG: hypothetical protein A2X04_16665 [Bacteroidetes bacterium GWF2_41_9]HAM09199.1 hypothetical protein [Bacteroidales bacterium]HBH83124.1 hypothetical protein [Bacteroidales bacterium]
MNLSFPVMRKISLPLFIILFITNSSIVFSGPPDSTISFFPENRIYPVIFLDPLECQIMSGSYLLSQSGKNLSLYSTVNMGFTLPVIAGRGKKVAWELNFGTAIFSQFDLIKKDDGTCLAGLMNNDFKLSGDLTIRKNNNLLRLRTYHLSSHLGDDYLQRYSDTLTNDKSANYEQADLTYMGKYGNNYWYAGAGYIYTIHVFRERFSILSGGVLNFREENPVSYFTGIDIKILAENDFYPDIRTAFGINLNRKSEPLIRIWAEYCSGKLPYSTIDYGRVNWFGMAMALNIIK